MKMKKRTTRVLCLILTLVLLMNIPIVSVSATGDEPDVQEEQEIILTNGYTEETPTEELETPAEEPEDSSEEPGAPAEEPGAPAEEPEAPAEEPEAPAEEPEAPAEEPEDPTEEPEASEENPRVSADGKVLLGDGFERASLRGEPLLLNDGGTRSNYTVTVNVGWSGDESVSVICRPDIVYFSVEVSSDNGGNWTEYAPGTDWSVSAADNWSASWTLPTQDEDENSLIYRVTEQNIGLSRYLLPSDNPQTVSNTSTLSFVNTYNDAWDYSINLYWDREGDERYAINTTTMDRTPYDNATYKLDVATNKSYNAISPSCSDEELYLLQHVIQKTIDISCIFDLLLGKART